MCAKLSLLLFTLPSILMTSKRELSGAFVYFKLENLEKQETNALQQVQLSIQLCLLLQLLILRESEKPYLKVKLLRLFVWPNCKILYCIFILILWRYRLNVFKPILNRSWSLFKESLLKYLLYIYVGTSNYNIEVFEKFIFW